MAAGGFQQAGRQRMLKRSIASPESSRTGMRGGLTQMYNWQVVEKACPFAHFPEYPAIVTPVDGILTIIEVNIPLCGRLEEILRRRPGAFSGFFMRPAPLFRYPASRGRNLNRFHVAPAASDTAAWDDYVALFGLRIPARPFRIWVSSTPGLRGEIRLAVWWAITSAS